MKYEIWRPVIGYEGLYEVSNLGAIKSLIQWNGTNTRILSQENVKGYRRVVLSCDGKTKKKTVHRLVAEVFIKKLDGRDYVNHKNGNKSDNRVENLEWCTISENAAHSIHVLGNKTSFMRNPTSKSIKQYSIDGEYIKKRSSVKNAAKSIGVTSTAIIRNIKGKSHTSGGFIWKYF